jgi:hypothetical protein
MSEAQPLLVHDPESPQTKPAKPSWRARTAQFLELPILHKSVIALIAIDAICVLADLAYTFLTPDCPAPESPVWLEVFAHISLVITTLFLIEIPLSIWALGFQHLNPFGPVPHSGLHAFDAIVIVTTFTLEVTLRGREKELAGLLVILRLWRLVKLVGGVAAGVGKIDEATIELLEETRRELEKTKAELATAQEENKNLKEKLNPTHQSTCT